MHWKAKADELKKIIQNNIAGVPEEGRDKDRVVPCVSRKDQAVRLVYPYNLSEKSESKKYFFC